MKTITTPNPDRQYYIDWLRILLILSVFLFHIGMVFNTWGWHIKNDQTYGGMLRYIMIHLHNWRMPLLFLISGAGTYYALGKRTPKQYLGERARRLLIPLIAGIFILVPVQVYIEKSAQYSSLPEFYMHMFEGTYPSGNFSWHHLWFIAYLFLLSLIISPFLNFFRSGRFDLFIGKLSRIISRPLGANIFLVPLLASQFILRPFFPDFTNALVNDWAAIAYYLIFFLSGYILLSSKPIIEAIRKQKLLFLAEGIMITILWFTLPGMAKSEDTQDLIWNILAVFLAWSCAMTAIGFAKQYLNKNSKFRKLATEAIYPFYLLHQPAIVIIGHFIIQWDIATGWKVVLITFSAFFSAVSIYWLLIRPFNLSRMLFGMPRLKEKRPKPIILSPVKAILAYAQRSAETLNFKKKVLNPVSQNTERTM
ncbi:MAG: acyltransferase family protein [Bacteroidota bacterium]